MDPGNIGSIRRERTKQLAEFQSTAAAHDDRRAPVEVAGLDRSKPAQMAGTAVVDEVLAGHARQSSKPKNPAHVLVVLFLPLLRAQVQP